MHAAFPRGQRRLRGCDGTSCGRDEEAVSLQRGSAVVVSSSTLAPTDCYHCCSCQDFRLRLSGEQGSGSLANHDGRSSRNHRPG